MERRNSKPSGDKTLVDILSENGLATFPPSGTKGRSPEDPILIEGVGDYVGMEYAVIDFLFAHTGYSLAGQWLLERRGRVMDGVKVLVEGGEVDLFFDITEGFGRF